MPNDLRYNPVQPLIKNKINWWNAEKSPHEMITSVISILEQDYTQIHAKYTRYLRAYSTSVSDVGVTSMFPDLRVGMQKTNTQLSYNVIKSIIDAVVSKIGKNKVRPMFLTSGADWSLQQKAKKLTQFFDGLFADTKVYFLAQKILQDACLFGTGILKIYLQDGKPHFERILPNEILIDILDGYYQTPRSLYHKKIVDREVLAELYPDHVDCIKKAGKADTGSSGINSTSDLVDVVEAFHLGNPGRHVICVDSGTLVDEEYNNECFPYEFFRWNDLPAGFWGTGIADDIYPIQLDLARNVQTISECLKLMATPKVLVHAGSQVNTAHLNNEVGTIIKWTGDQPPQFIVPPSVSPELIAQTENLYKKAYEISGISQLSAQSKKPSGLDSGVALREYNDIESERFMIQGQRWEAFFIDVTRKTIELLESSKKTSVKVSTKDSGLEILTWKDVRLAEDDYLLDVFPTSALPQTPAFRLQTVMEYVNIGLIPKEYALQLLDFPDLQEFIETTSGVYNLTQKTITKMMDTEKYVEPDPNQDLIQTRKIVQQYYINAKLNNIDQKRLDLLQKYISDIDNLMQIAQQGTQVMTPATPSAGVPPGMPPIPPGMPPMPPGMPPPPMEGGGMM